LALRRFVNGRQTVVDVFEAQAKRRPRAVALVFEGREFTWAEFDAR
jgi:non-ribosomal peptide synthetase component F